MKVVIASVLKEQGVIIVSEGGGGSDSAA